MSGFHMLDVVWLKTVEMADWTFSLTNLHCFDVSACKWDAKLNWNIKQNVHALISKSSVCVNLDGLFYLVGPKLEIY